MNARSCLTALDNQIVRCTLTTESKINLDKITVSLDIPSKFELAKARVKNPENMKALDAYIDAQDSKKPYRRANCGFAAFPIE